MGETEVNLGAAFGDHRYQSEAATAAALVVVDRSCVLV